MPNLPLDEPLVFTPFFRPQVWGGRRLADLLGKPLPVGVAVGESWELSTQALHVSRVSEGPWAGASLAELWNDHREELIGDDPSPEFPWLIKWLDCHELLSVQVHPDDATAKRLLGEPCGKTESWVVLQAEPTACIYAGLKPGVTPDELQRRSRDGTVAECLHRFTPQPGDCLHIPAGTVHAVGGGVLLAEVQQTSDATFRLFDWNRVDAQGKSRGLHLSQAMKSIDFTRGPVHPVIPERIGDNRELLVRCPYYRLERIALSAPWDASADGLRVAMVLAGAALLTSTDGRYRRRFQAGETVLIPASATKVRWEPLPSESASLLWMTRPASLVSL